MDESPRNVKTVLAPGETPQPIVCTTLKLNNNVLANLTGFEAILVCRMIIGKQKKSF